MFYPNEENALLTVDLLIQEICIKDFLKKYFIKYADAETGKIETIDYNLKTAIDTSLIDGNPILSIDVFKSSLIAQIGTHNTEESILEYVPPPFIFIELWRYNDSSIRNFEYDSFSVTVNGEDFEFLCIGILIHTPDHFKTVVFDNDHIFLYDDEAIIDLNLESDRFNAYQQIELQYMQYHSVMLVYQVRSDQFVKLMEI